MILKNKIFTYLDKLYPITGDDCIDISYNKDIKNIVEKLFGITNITFNDWIRDRGYQQYGILDHYDDKYWYQNGLTHRDNDLPAKIYANGTKYWYKNGKRHRDNDKPAIIFANGEKRWYKYGKEYTPNIMELNEN